MSVLPDPDSDFGARVRARLREEYAIWLTTVGADGTPQPNPVWFLWEEESESLLVYNRNTAKRLAHVAANPRVCAHFDGDGRGGDVVVLTGTAEAAADVPAPDRHEAYLVKYAGGIERIGLTPESFAAVYGAALRIRVAKVRGF
jgi:PPOX class probable F420-dependent enzyme